MLSNYFLLLSGVKVESNKNDCKTKQAAVQIPSSSTNKS